MPKYFRPFETFWKIFKNWKVSNKSSFYFVFCISCIIHILYFCNCCILGIFIFYILSFFIYFVYFVYFLHVETSKRSHIQTANKPKLLLLQITRIQVPRLYMPFVAWRRVRRIAPENIKKVLVRSKIWDIKKYQKTQNTITQ